MIRWVRVTEETLPAAPDLREACMKEAAGRDALPEGSLDSGEGMVLNIIGGSI